MPTPEIASKSARKTGEYADEIVFRLSFAVGYQRTLKKISLDKLSKLSGVPSDTIKRIEEYRLIPDVRTLICILKALGFILNIDNLDDY